MRRCKPVAVSRGLARNRRAHCNPVVCWQCQSGSDLAVMNSNLTGFTRNLLWGRCDVRAFWRTPLRDAISRFPGFLSDLLLRFKKSARREGARDPENGKSSFHTGRTLIGHRLTACKLGHRLGDLRLRSKQAAFCWQPCSWLPRSTIPLRQCTSVTETSFIPRFAEAADCSRNLSESAGKFDFAHCP